MQSIYVAIFELKGTGTSSMFVRAHQDGEIASSYLGWPLVNHQGPFFILNSLNLPNPFLPIF